MEEWRYTSASQAAQTSAVRFIGNSVSPSLRGSLRPGEALPPGRVLARRLGVSRGTVTVAYQRLWSEGLIDSRQGAGTFVSDDVPKASDAAVDVDGHESLRPLPVWSSFGLSTTFGRPARFDFRTGLPDASLFPYETWRRLHMEQLRAEVMGKGAYTVAADRDVTVQSLARFTLDQPLRPGIVLGYGAIAIDEIQAGLDILKASFELLTTDAGSQSDDERRCRE